MILMIFVLLSNLMPPPTTEERRIDIVFWNVENFFDYFDDGLGASDSEFSSRGERRWTRKRFLSKCLSISKALFIIGDRHGRMPDIVALAEVENRQVLRRLLDETPLWKHGYRMVHYESPDPRGIDCALLYRPERIVLTGSRPCRIEEFRTRDILLAQFVTSEGDSLAVTVNHHPSKYGGESSNVRRKKAIGRLCSLSDTLRMQGWNNVVAVGDFNDTPGSDIYREMGSMWQNLALPLSLKGIGSIRFDGAWQLIDQCFVSMSLAGKAEMEVCTIPFLMVKDSSHPGMKPLRTYSGPRYLGGVSDHCPIFVSVGF